MGRETNTRPIAVSNTLRAGILDKRLLAAPYFTLRQHGARELKNAVPLIGGGVRRRPGVAELGGCPCGDATSFRHSSGLDWR